MTIPYELLNTETEQVEAVQHMRPSEAEDRNSELRANREPHRWVSYEGEE